ncbi:hypothetical protein [Holospora curviuscula]|uniref:Uncharacterized protein n=1 Tax=Holospora curviuscula TaxID=1082868 RepID=A0A2S5REI0_9PROT|nr:hypothetical protein [Holospora curviuscula]PPE05622.1 hypothetical protein HCUR_00270 [Holospora curviuscula]
MTEKKSSSFGYQRFFWVLMGCATVLYAGSCIGIGQYMLSRARKLVKFSHPQSIKIEYFPFPVVKIQLNSIKQKELKIDTLLNISPFLPGIFSGQWARCVANFRLTGPDLTGTARVKGIFDPRKNLNSLTDALRFWATLEKLEGHGNFKFQEYTGIINVKSPKPREECWSYTLYKKDELLSSGRGFDETPPDFIPVKTYINFRFESEFFSLISEVLGKLKVFPEVFSWLQVNTQHLKDLLLPFRLDTSLKLWMSSEAFRLYLKNHENYNHTAEPHPLNNDLILNWLNWLKIFSGVPFRQETIFDVNIAEEGKSKFILYFEQDTPSKDIANVRAHLELNWGSLLKYFEKKTPKSYKNARKLLDSALSIINKNKDVSHIETDVFIKYNVDRFKMEELTINGLSFPQLMQAYFSNLETLKSQKSVP